jgi:hypothetical protein
VQFLGSSLTIINSTSLNSKCPTGISGTAPCIFKYSPPKTTCVSHTLRSLTLTDGHERLDVVEYHKNEFLLLMAKYWARMAKWEEKESRLMRSELELNLGEKQIIAMFQDESYFHTNEYRSTIWCIPLFLYPRDCSHDL